MKKFLLLTLALFATVAIGAIRLDVDELVSPDQTKVWSLPSITDTLIGRLSTDTLQNKTINRTQNTLTNLDIVNADVSASAAIDYSKFASLATGQVLLGNAGVPTATTLSGGATVGATGVVTLGNSAVITQLLTGYTSGAGTVSASDSVLSAIQKLNGNDGLKVDKSALAAKGSIISASAASTPVNIAVGNDGEVLSANSGNANGLSYRLLKENLSDMSQLQGFEGAGAWSTGQNALIMGGGTMMGSFVIDTVFPYKYTQGVSSINDYFCSPAMPVPQEFKGPTIYIGTPYSYNGSNSDIQISVFDVTNSTPLATFPVVNIQADLKSSTQLMAGTFPSSTNAYRICYQTKVANSGKILNLGPIVSTKSLADFGSVSNIGYFDSVSYTPSFTALGSPASVEFTQSRVGDTLKINGSFACSGVGSGSEARVSIPQITDLFTTINLKLSGTYTRGSSGAVVNKGGFIFSEASKGYFVFSAPSVISGTNADTYTKALGSDVCSSSSDIIKINAEFKISGWGGSNSAIASPTQQISSDTMNFTFKSSAIVDADPVGTYNIYDYVSSTNNSSVSATIASQTVSSMNNDGVRIYGRAFNANSVAGSPARMDIKIGKNLKSYSVFAYGGSGKTLPIVTRYVAGVTSFGTTASYDEKTGILTIDAGLDQVGGSSTRNVGTSANAASPSNYGNGYFTFFASTTPSIAALPVFNPKIAVVRYDTPATRHTMTTSYTTVPLNSIEDPSGIASLASNQFTLQPGRYHISFSGYFYAASGAASSILSGGLYTTGGTLAVGGTQGFGLSSPSLYSPNSGSGIITITSPTTYEFRAKTGTSYTAFYGDSSGSPDNVKLAITIQKL